MADLVALRELYAWMREARVLHARSGELELRLEALPALPPTTVAEPPADPADEERRDLETLLHSSGVEAEPFLRALQRGRAA